VSVPVVVLLQVIGVDKDPSRGERFEIPNKLGLSNVCFFAKRRACRPLNDKE
jgi:hypothetical protein